MVVVSQGSMTMVAHRQREFHPLDPGKKDGPTPRKGVGPTSLVSSSPAEATRSRWKKVSGDLSRKNRGADGRNRNFSKIHTFLQA